MVLVECKCGYLNRNREVWFFLFLFPLSVGSCQYGPYRCINKRGGNRKSEPPEDTDVDIYSEKELGML